MKLKLFAFVLVAVGLMSFHDEAAYTIDIATSKVQWLAKKTVGEHNGEVKLKSGFINTHAGVPEGGEFVIDMTSITDLDIADAEGNKKLVNHLKGEDFFNTAGFPTAKLEIKRFEAIKPDADKNNYKATAALTIKGITNDIAFPARVDIKDGKLNATAKITIDRTKWDVKYKSKSIFPDLGDKFIYDNVDFTVTLNGKK